MNISAELIALGFACILLLIAIVGGGFEVWKVNVPKVGKLVRTIAAVLGTALLVISFPKDTSADPALDAAHAGCSRGDFSACDTLYRDSPTGSEYERFGATCGDRFNDLGRAPASCAEAFAELDRHQTACREGDFSACDTLYRDSPTGSEYERFGATCGDHFNDPDSAPESCETLS
jgi:hypothetical protein